MENLHIGILGIVSPWGVNIQNPIVFEVLSAAL